MTHKSQKNSPDIAAASDEPRPVASPQLLLETPLPNVARTPSFQQNTSEGTDRGKLPYVQGASGLALLPENLDSGFPSG